MYVFVPNTFGMDEVNKTPICDNPIKNANICSKLFFWWTVPQFIKGFTKDLDEDDLFQPIPDHHSSKLGDKLENAWKSSKSLNVAILKTFGLEYVFYSSILLIEGTFNVIVQPLALRHLIFHFSTNGNNTKLRNKDIYLSAGVIVFTTFLSVFIFSAAIFGLYQVSMKIRIACCSMIYRKLLKVNRSALKQFTIGHIVNLMSNDATSIESTVLYLQTVWAAPIHVIGVFYILHALYGMFAVVGIFFMICVLPVYFYVGALVSKLRLKARLRTDERIRLMNEIVSGIQVIKMYTWEKSFAKLVEEARRLEVKYIGIITFLKGLTVFVLKHISHFAIFLCVLTYIYTGHDITAEYVFVLTSLYNILHLWLCGIFPRTILHIAEGAISIKRVQMFLLHGEKSNAVENISLINDEFVTHTNNEKVALVLEKISANWTTSSEIALSRINVKLKSKELLAIVGPVGSGKSSILNVLLKELQVTTGYGKIHGKISYASQEPWLFSSSIKQNILFGLPMNAERYKLVLEVCSLEKDLLDLQYGDNTIVGERGVLLSGGQKSRIGLARAVYRDVDIYLLDDPLSAVDVAVGNQLFEECISKFLKDKSVIFVTHQLQYLKNVNHILLLKNSKVVSSGTFQELQDTLHFKEVFKEGESTHIEEDATYIKSESKEIKLNTRSPLRSKELRSTGKIDFIVIKSYILAGGNACLVIMIVIVMVLTQGCYSGSQYFLGYWMNWEQTIMEYKNSNTTISDNKNNTKILRNIYIYIYAAIIVSAIFFSLLQCFSYFTVCMRSCVRLHKRMFSNILRVPMRFFNTNTTGIILNRFSKDVGVLDDTIPSILKETIGNTLVLVSVTTIVTIVNYWNIFPIILMLLVLNITRIVCLRTTRNVKRLEGITRSPLIGHVTATLQGLSTIRAFGTQSILEEEFDNHQNLHTSACFLFLGCSRMFCLFIDLLVSILLATVTFGFMIFDTEKYGGNVGLAITQCIYLMSAMQFGIRQLAELETHMTSVERVVEYVNIKPEKDEMETEPPPSWPEKGNILFKCVSMRYSPVTPYILKNLTFSISHKEKIGVVGRTGAGKSSLIYALFQLCETDGNILIDGLDTKHMALQSLRSSISIIPQEPVLFSGTLRKNLDPFNEFSDSQVWNALQDVELKSTIQELPLCLNSDMTTGGKNFSVGQRQLVCFARAIMRNKKILIIDEATANVDTHTDSLIQKAIRKKFSECTILTIAHRLHTVMNSSKVLVMDAGTVIEFDHPHILLQNERGKFYEFVQETGESIARTLHKIAKNNYDVLNISP